VSENWRLWRRNALALAGMVAFVFSLTTVIYHRAWEFLTPLEPPHGTARFSPGKPPVLRSYGGIGLAALLPDGSLWVDRVGYHGFYWGARWMSLGGNEFAPGSNWVDAVANNRETVGIRSDGTLWVSEKPQQIWTGKPRVEEPASLIQFGHDTNWQNVIRRPAWAMLLLKRDGTLWDWGTNNFNRKQKEKSLRDFRPRRLGKDSDWSRLLTGENWIYAYAWKKDGTAWGLYYPDAYASKQSPGQELQPGIDIERLPTLDNSHWRTVTILGDGCSFLALRDDGTLWSGYWHQFSARQLGMRGWSTNAVHTDGAALTQIGKDSDWAEIVGQWWTGLTARKTDGTLWKWGWDADADNHYVLKPFNQPPVRLGTHSDWVALGGTGGEILSLAADGSLWCWPGPEPVAILGEDSNLSLAASRKPARIENIFGARE
jgi:hypothetical protein